MNIVERILEEIQTVFVGKKDVIEKMLMAIIANGHILLEDIPGVGKTTLALAFSKVLDVEYHRIQFTPDTMPSDIIGFSIYSREKNRLIYKPGVVICNLLLGDEINRTSPRTQAALLEVMEERTVTIDGVTHVLPDPFICIATQNPLGSIGTQPLPESQLDRFMVCLHIGYPTAKEQLNILLKEDEGAMQRVRKILDRDMLRSMQDGLKHVKMIVDVKEYVIALCEATRENPMVELGVSPRGVIALSNMSKACAMVKNRNYVIPEDVQAVFEDVCIHRIVLRPQARMEGRSAREILREILNSVDPPDRRAHRRRKQI